MAVSILKKSISPINKTRSLYFSNEESTVECEIIKPSLDHIVTINDNNTLDINEDYFSSPYPTVYIDSDSMKKYKGKTLQKTDVSTRLIIILKEDTIKDTSISERWKKMNKEAEMYCKKNYSHMLTYSWIKNKSWIVILATFEWKKFYEIVEKYTLKDTPNEFDLYIGKLWKQIYGLKTPRIEENNEYTPEINYHWELAVLHSKKISNRMSSRKQTATYWNRVWGFI